MEELIRGISLLSNSDGPDDKCQSKRPSQSKKMIIKKYISTSFLHINTNIPHIYIPRVRRKLQGQCRLYVEPEGYRKLQQHSSAPIRTVATLKSFHHLPRRMRTRMDVKPAEETLPASHHAAVRQSLSNPLAGSKYEVVHAGRWRLQTVMVVMQDAGWEK